MSSLRLLPSVDELLQKPRVKDWLPFYGRSLVLKALRCSLDDARAQYTSYGSLPDEEALLQRASELMETWTTPSLQPVINATGVILHTNLGRAPLSEAALRALRETAGGYSNLEYDLNKGQRGSRLIHAEELLQRLTGAEAALVVNNNAAAVLLALSALARGKGVVIARSQLVEIGGGFRVPDVMKQSGAKLVEVGTTNRVHLSDYEQALTERPIALVMRAHRSNFRIVGFTSEPSLKELVQFAHRAGLALIDDLGSGTLIDTTRFGLAHEPMIQESLDAGADVVCFSGDKLLGGPQAGIILGREELGGRLSKHPLARAVRADKLCLAALAETLLHYLKDEAEREIPVWRMISAETEELQSRAQKWSEELGKGSIQPGLSTVGGGSLPEETLPTHLLALEVSNPNRFLAGLRKASPPIIARLENDLVVFDPRTVLSGQEADLVGGIKETLKEYH